jgi:hypothetical protein
MKTYRERVAIAEEIVRRVDTVALLKCDEVLAIHARAVAGEFDDIFDSGVSD